MQSIKQFELNFTVLKATAIVGFFTLLSRLVGLIRDRLFASHFGAGDTLDIYYAAFRIPDLVFNLLILGTLSVAFIPIFTELLISDKDKAYRTANSVLNFSFLLMSAVCLGLIIFARPLAHLLVPGFEGQKFNDTVILTRVLLLSPIIFTASNIFSSILNSQKKFIIANVAPIMYNVGIIFGLLVLYPKFGLYGLGWGVILGALLHLLVQIPEAVHFGYYWQGVLDLKDPAIKKMLKLFLPRILGVDNSQVSLLIGSVVGSVLVSGSIAVFNLANNLQAVPLGVFAISTAVAVFPLLSEFYSKRNENEFAKSLGQAISQILFFMIPFTVLLLLFRAHIVRLAFGSGKFNWDNTILTFNTLGMFSLSLFAQGLSPLLARAFYARQDTKTPVIISLCTMAINALLTYLLGKQYGAPGMAAGFSLSAIFNAIVLYFIMHHRLAKSSSQEAMDNFNKTIFDSSTKIIISSFFMGLAGYGALYMLAPYVDTHTVIGLLIQSGLAFIAASAVFYGVGKFLKLSQLDNLFGKKSPSQTLS
ncbi:MAG: murein biosynthesis integral membrane protein MurJ [Candidatus Doudnabacteria bacterium]|nr:murein biosynthesis integral membrane protein MurJ [Candidatus Doudnabacteria bacterium]